MSPHEGWAPRVSGWSWGDGPTDNWRSLFRQPLVDPCRSGAGVADQSTSICGPERPFQCIQAGVTDEMVCYKLGVTPRTFIFMI